MCVWEGEVGTGAPLNAPLVYLFVTDRKSAMSPIKAKLNEKETLLIDVFILGCNWWREREEKIESETGQRKCRSGEVDSADEQRQLWNQSARGCSNQRRRKG